jgi:D-alanyl-D-alanine dipeptidase
MQNNFVYLKDIAPTIKQEIKYATTDNFTGTVVAGYHDAVAIAKIEMARALAKAQKL